MPAWVQQILMVILYAVIGLLFVAAIGKWIIIPLVGAL